MKQKFNSFLELLFELQVNVEMAISRLPFFCAVDFTMIVLLCIDFHINKLYNLA
ncbi:hypothetical protein VJJ19_04165 [Parvimonas sp. D4]|nr:hypothetical protein [Parvimonas sp. D4]